MALMVIPAHGKAPIVQQPSHLGIASHVFTQSVDQQHRATKCNGRHGPVVHGQLARLALQGAASGLFHGMRAMTSATAAVSFLA